MSKKGSICITIDKAFTDVSYKRDSISGESDSIWNFPTQTIQQFMQPVSRRTDVRKQARPELKPSATSRLSNSMIQYIETTYVLTS